MHGKGGAIRPSPLAHYNAYLIVGWHRSRMPFYFVPTPPNRGCPMSRDFRDVGSLSTGSRTKSGHLLSTPLTQQHRREAKGHFELPNVIPPQLQRVCRGCGAVLRSQKKHCFHCGVNISRANMIDIAHRGRIASKSAESRARLSAAQKRQQAARRDWVPSSLPSWLTRESYREVIWPRLAEGTVPS